MISKEIFLKIVTLIKEQDAIDEEVSKALEKVCGSWVMFNTDNKKYDALLLILKETIKDSDDLISWFLYEDVDKKIWLKDGTEIDVSTPELLYDYFKKYG